MISAKTSAKRTSREKSFGLARDQQQERRSLSENAWCNPNFPAPQTSRIASSNAELPIANRIPKLQLIGTARGEGRAHTTRTHRHSMLSKSENRIIEGELDSDEPKEEAESNFHGSRGHQTRSRGDNTFRPSTASNNAIDVLASSALARFSRPLNMQKSVELDNWPCSISSGSTTWIRKIEQEMDTRFASIQSEDVEARITACHEAFALFVEVFKSCKPFLSKVLSCYQQYINRSRERAQIIEAMKAEIYASHQKNEDQIQQSVYDAAAGFKELQNEIQGMKLEKLAIEKQHQKALEELAAARAESKRIKEQHDLAVLRSQSYCAGYKWIVKNIQKTDSELSDLDAFETVQLTQKLEHEISMNQAHQLQIQYLSSTSELVHARTLLDEERRLFDLETQRIQANLDDAYTERTELSRMLDDVQAKQFHIEEEKAKLQHQVDTFHLPPLGVTDNIPSFLRTKYPVVARQIEPKKLSDIVQTCFNRCAEQIESSTYPDILPIFLSVVKEQYESHGLAEWSYNVLNALDANKNDEDCKLLGRLLSSSIGPHALLDRCVLYEEFAEACADISVMVNTSERARDEVFFKDISANLPVIFPTKPRDHVAALDKLLKEDQFKNSHIKISRIASKTPTSTEKLFLDQLWAQHCEEISNYEEKLRTLLIDVAHHTRRIKSPTVKVTARYLIKPEDLRAQLKIIEPRKSTEDVAVMLYRAFKLPSYQEILAAIMPQEKSILDEGDLDIAAHRAVLSSYQEPLEHVIARLGTAGLLQATLPDSVLLGSTRSKLIFRLRRRQCRLEALRNPSSEVQDVNSTSEVAGAAVPGIDIPWAASLPQKERSREKAIASALQTCTKDPIARWTKITVPIHLQDAADMTFLEALVANQSYLLAWQSQDK